MKKDNLTDFEWDVLRKIMEIPIGETRTYKWVAEELGRPQASRAVGQALRKNPYPLIIPCHRVVKSDGSTGGYCGREGSTKKARLIDTERQIARRLNSAFVRG